MIKGTPSPPIENLPNHLGVDPHGPDASEQFTGRQQVSDFLATGGVVNDTCGLAPCYLDGYAGPQGAGPGATMSRSCHERKRSW